MSNRYDTMDRIMNRQVPPPTGLNKLGLQFRLPEPKVPAGCQMGLCDVLGKMDQFYIFSRETITCWLVSISRTDLFFHSFSHILYFYLIPSHPLHGRPVSGGLFEP